MKYNSVKNVLLVAKHVPILLKQNAQVASKDFILLIILLVFGNVILAILMILKTNFANNVTILAMNAMELKNSIVKVADKKEFFQIIILMKLELVNVLFLILSDYFSID